jgi:hypothetical protein
MKYFKTWQDALRYFLDKEGILYDDGFDLVSEFEQKLYKNSKGVYFMYTGAEND